jgi:thiol-disulfide isomerase/thioredoxin
MKKAIFKTLCILTLILVALSVSGAAATTASAGKVLEITQLSQINTALHKGPVFLRLGAVWCPHCKVFGPTLAKLAKEYAGKATFMSADIDKSPKIATYFGVRVIPDCTVIVGVKNGKYIYMQQNGKTTTIRSQARITGDHTISVYEKVLNFATKK